MQRLLNWVLTVPASEDDWGYISTRLFYHILLFSLFMMVILSVASLLGYGRVSSRFPLIFALMLMTTIDFVILKLGYRDIALTIFIWAIWAIVAYNSLITIGVYTPAYLMVNILIIISSIGLHRRISLIFTSVIVGFGLILVYQHAQGSIPTPVVKNLEPLGMWITTTTVFVVTSYIALSIRQRLTTTANRLRTSEALYRAIIEDQEEFVIRWKPDGQFTFANAAYCRYFGVNRDNILNLNMYDLIPESSRQWIYAKIAQLTPERPSLTNEHIVDLPDGNRGWHQWTDRAIYDQNGVLVEYQSVGREITIIKESEERQLELQITQEREIFLREFLNSMSHDLQSPLSVMRTNIYLMQQMPESIDKRVERINSQIDKLSDIFADILHVARLTHLPELNRRMCDLNSIIENSLNPLLDQINEKNIELSISDIPYVHLMADVSELERAFSNLIGNAIKYTPDAGDIRIDVTKQEATAVIEIKDTGIGIAEEDLPHVFERFYRAKNAVDFEKGTGLGLAIVKRIIELHDGTIEANSVNQQGTTFIVRLPLTS